jgi:Tol biopolymer transport system component
MRPDGSQQRQLTMGSGGRPFWSPDGRRLVYMLWNTDPCYPGPATKCAITDIWTVNADGSGERKLLDRALQPAWSPDGRRLLFRMFLGPAEADMGVGALMVAWADGSHVRTIFPRPTYDATRRASQPAWSPNGKWVVFDRTPWSDLKPRLSLIKADGSHLHRLTNGTYPAWSPNGKLIAFERDVHVGRTWKTGVWVLSLASKDARRISAEGTRGRCPTWSPGGKRLAFVTTVYRSQPEPQPPKISTTLSIVRPDGRARKKLANADPCVFESSFPSPPSWSRDGRNIYYSG